MNRSSLSPTTMRDLLTNQIASLEDFLEVGVSVVEYMEGNRKEVPASTTSRYSNYVLPRIAVEERVVQVRPLNSNLFISDANELREGFREFVGLLDLIAEHGSGSPFIEEKHSSFVDRGEVERVLYTLQQAVGCGLDLFTTTQVARKNVGTRFEDLIGCVLKRLGITYERNVGIKILLPSTAELDPQDRIYYGQEADFILSPFESVRTTPDQFDPNEVLVSMKTTSKDRTAPIFLAKTFLSRALGEDVKTVAIFLTDVQRSGELGISNTFVPNVFMIYTELLNSLDGVYHIDPPPHIHRFPWKNELSVFSRLLLEDLRGLGIRPR